MEKNYERFAWRKSIEVWIFVMTRGIQKVAD